MWTPDEADLATYAERHVRYEVDMVTGQARELIRRHPSGMPTPTTGFPGPIDDALLEAILVHLRLLEDFLGSRKDGRDVIAEDWLPSWSPQTFLTCDQRDAINLQLAHMSSERDWGYPWDIAAMVTECCLAIKSFIEALDQHSPRAAAFTGVREIVEKWLAGDTLLQPRLQ